MVDVQGKLREWKDYIILLGLAIGPAKILDLLPEKIDFFSTYTQYVYLGVVGLAGYCFFTFYWGSKSKKSAPYVQSMPARNLTNPDYQRELRKQMGGYKGNMPIPPTNLPPGAQPHQPTKLSPNASSKVIFETFTKE